MSHAVSPLTAPPSTPEPAPRDEVMLSLTGKHPPALPAKLQAGRLRSEVFARARLTERPATSDASLVLIAAPAGFGKPTLLAQWASQDPRKFAFVSLDVADNDPLEMWGCIVLSIRRVQPSFGIGLEPMLNSVGGTVLDALVRYVLAELEQLDEPVVLV